MFSLPLSAQQTLFFEEWAANQAAPLTELQNELLQRIASTTDGSNNLYVAASTFNETTQVHDLLLAKYDNTGQLLWDEQFNISGGGNVLTGAIALDASNNPVVTGAVLNGSNNYDALTLKYSSNGTYQWHALYNGSASHYDGGSALKIDGSGNVYVTGVSTSTTTLMNFLTLKYNSSGTQQWASIFDGDGLMDVAAAVSYGSGYVRTFGAVQKDPDEWDLVAVVYNDSDGSYVADYSSLQNTVIIEQITGFATDAGGNIYVTGNVLDGQTGRDFMTAKLDAALALEWISYENSGGSAHDVAKAVAVDGSGNVYVTGYATTANGRDFMTVKYDSDGGEQWTVFHNGAANENDEGTDIAVDGDGNVFVTGFSNEKGTSDYHTFWLDASDGSIIWDARFNSVYNRDDLAAVLHIDGLGNLFVTGRTTALTFESEESNEVTTVKYRRTEIIVPPDTEAQSSAICFIKNNGQLLDTEQDPVPDVKFYSERTWPGLYFSDDKVSMVLSLIDEDTSTVDTMHRVDMLLGAGVRDQAVLALEERADYYNYYLGHIPEGRERVSLHQRLVHANAFDGIDLHHTNNAAGIKYDFVVKPGADPDSILLTFDGQTGLSVNGNGELVIETSIGNIVLPEPAAYEIENGEEVVLQWTPEYHVDGDVVTIATEDFDGGKPLVIRIAQDTDAELDCEVGNDGIEYSTYYGGANDDVFTDIAAEITTGLLPAPTFVYITGSTFSGNFPDVTGDVQLQGQQGAIVMQLLDLQRIWVTFLNGKLNFNGLPGRTNSNAIAADKTQGKVYFTGLTNCVDLPVKGGGYQGAGISGSYFNAYFAKLNSTSGSLDYLTYLGGENNAEGQAICIRPSDAHVFVGGDSWNDPSPNTSFYQDSDDDGWGFIAEFDLSNQLVWCTRFGEATAKITSLAIDKNNDLIATGITDDWPDPLMDFVNPGGGALFINTPPNDSEGEAFIAKFDIQSNNRVLVWSTLITGTGQDWVHEVDVNSLNQIICAGVTESSGFQGLTAANSNQGCGDVFIIKFNNNGSPVKTIFHGGSGTDGSDALCFPQFTAPLEGNRMGLALDGNDNIYIASLTNTAEDATIPFPTMDAGTYYQAVMGNNGDEEDQGDAAVIVLNANLEDVWVTYFGGRSGIANTNGNREEGTGILVGGQRIYLVGNTTSKCTKKIPLKNAAPVSNYFATELNKAGASLPGIRDGFIATFEPVDFPTQTNEGKDFSENPIKAYPAPADGLLLVEIPGQAGIVRFSLQDLFGRILYSGEFNLNISSKIEINTAGLPGGVYFLTAKMQDETLSRKVIVQHK